jgi:LmbE family N-acetylglucosaminyl deacetylase
MLLTSYRAACGAGYKVTVVCLSLDERGESAKLRKQPGMTLERVKAAQRAESEKAAKALGVYDLISFDLGDYPLRLTDEGKYCLADAISYRTSGGPDGGFPGPRRGRPSMGRERSGQREKCSMAACFRRHKLEFRLRLFIARRAFFSYRGTRNGRVSPGHVSVNVTQRV